jgi:hypothetical protein
MLAVERVKWEREDLDLGEGRVYVDSMVWLFLSQREIVVKRFDSIARRRRFRRRCCPTTQTRPIKRTPKAANARVNITSVIFTMPADAAERTHEPVRGM